MESRSDEESGGCVCGGNTNSRPSAWPWSLQHITVRSRTAPHGDRRPPGRVRCTRRTTLHGARTHLTQLRGQASLEAFYWEQLAVLAYVYACNCSSSVFFAYDLPQKISAFTHYVLRVCVACFDVVFQHLLPNYFNRLLRPGWHVFFLQFTVSAHCCWSMEKIH